MRKNTETYQHIYVFWRSRRIYEPHRTVELINVTQSHKVTVILSLSLSIKQTRHSLIARLCVHLEARHGLFVLWVFHCLCVVCRVFVLQMYVDVCPIGVFVLPMWYLYK